MSRSHAVHHCPGRRAALRPTLVALGVAAALAGAPAHTAPLTIATIDWASDLATYNSWATCNVNSSYHCPDNPPPSNGSVLFSWGLDDQDNYNSLKTWTNSGETFTLTSISFAANATGVGSGITQQPNGNPGHTAGQGAAPAWEWNPDSQTTLLEDPRVKVTLNPTTASAAIIANTNVFSSTGGWYGAGGTNVNTRLTPVDMTIDLSASPITVNPGDVISFRLYEDYWDAQSQGGPDLVYAPMTITLNGEVPVTLGATTVNFDNVRMGTTSVVRETTVTNTGTASATNVQITPNTPSGTKPFAFSGNALDTTIAAGGSSTQGYSYTPTYVAGRTTPNPESLTPAPPGDQTIPKVTAYGGASASFTVSGNGVGPVFNLSGDGVSGLNVNLGTVSLNSTTYYDLTLKNLFGTDLGDLTDLTIINVGGIPPDTDPIAVLDLPDPSRPFVIAAADATGTPFRLKFSPGTAGIFTLDLTFLTDVNGPLYANNAFGNHTSYVVHIQGRAVGAAPLPATFWLLVPGLMVLVRRAAGRA